MMFGKRFLCNSILISTLQGALDHFVHVNDRILKVVAKSGSGMVWNPMSNGRLASGIADIPKYQKMGIKIGMGVARGYVSTSKVRYETCCK